MFLIAVILAGGGFYGGMKYAKRNPSAGDFRNFSPEGRQDSSENGRPSFMAGMGESMRGGSGFVAGEIISKDDESITVKLQDGGSKTVLLSESTEVKMLTNGDLKDLEIGQNVTVSGVDNSDGSVTAKTIQLR